MKTVLLGLDGATFTILDDLVARGLMPHLATFYVRAARAVLTSTTLPLTPQAWTSLATGRTAGHHGVSDWVRYEHTPGGTFGHINDSRDNHCETIWQYASRHGRRVTVLNYFGLAPPEPINGHSMPGFTSGRHLRRSSYPPDLFAKLEAIEAFDVKILGLDLEIERRGLQEMRPDEWSEWIEHHIRRDRAWAAVLDYLMVHEPSDLTAIVLDGVDKLQHLAYRYLDPALAPAEPTAWVAEVTRLARSYFTLVDELLARVLDRAGSQARVFVVSDHGFCASHEILYVNKWLADRGLLTWRGSVAEDDEQACASQRPADDTNAIDVQRSQAFALTPSCNGIFLNVPSGEYERVRDELTRGLHAILGGDGGQVVTAVRKREESFPGPFMKHCPDLTLTLRDHGFISVLNSREVVVPRSAATGTHHPNGIFLATGPGVRSGADLGRLSILDIAPLLAHSLGLEIPRDYEGVFPDAVYERSYLANDPPRVALASDQEVVAAQRARSSAMSPQSDGEADAEDAAIILQRLKSLGYME